MTQYIPKAAVVAEINKRLHQLTDAAFDSMIGRNLIEIRNFLDTVEVKEVDLMLHTIIAECCDWLATNTNLSHDEVEGCRNLMLTVKEEQCKAARKGE